MRICGVELKGSDAIFAIIEVAADGSISSVDCPIRKIKFGESTEQRSARDFFEAVCGFIRDQQIDRIAIKQRAKKGPFAGGPVTFKMEGLLQLNPGASTQILSAPAIAAAKRRHGHTPPAALTQYQEEAFMAACCAAMTP